MQDRFNFRFWYFNEVDGKWKPWYCDLMSVDGTCLPFDNGEGGAYTDWEHEFICEQCTGLKDKNGKLIYEGDIVREISKKEPEWEEYITAVEWNGCGFNLYRDDEFDFLVIGNIHENADLLGEE